MPKPSKKNTEEITDAARGLSEPRVTEEKRGTEKATPSTGKSPDAPERLERGVIFLLGVEGHKKGGFSDKEANLQYRLSRKYAENFRQKYKDPMEIQTFNSLNELVEKRPGRGVKKWTFIILVTHASGADPGGANEIFLGDRNYNKGELLDYVSKKTKKVEQFWKQFAKDSALIVVACGPAAHNADLGIYLREFFAVGGGVLLPKVNVDFTSDARLGTPALDEQGNQIVIKGKPQLRAINEDTEWLVVPPIPPEFRRE